ncbi:hypothetical protein CLAIMM_15165 [Cladophialophora immunda]|nr:hypothetical protein CLAIMM_15165 [Cladophialophora immunda]
MSHYPEGHPSASVPVGLWCQPCWLEFGFRGFEDPPGVQSAFPCDWTWTKSCAFCVRVRPRAGCVAVPSNLQAGCRAIQALIQRASAVAGGPKAIPAPQMEWLKSQARGLEKKFQKANRHCKVGRPSTRSQVGEEWVLPDAPMEIFPFCEPPDLGEEEKRTSIVASPAAAAAAAADDDDFGGGFETGMGMSPYQNPLNCREEDH